MRIRTKLAMIGAASILLATPAGAVPVAGVPAALGATLGLTLTQDRDRRSWRGEHRDRRWDDRRRGSFNLFIGPGGAGVTVGRSDRCAWLRDRASSTGSRYWWRRYRDCRSY